MTSFLKKRLFLILILTSIIVWTISYYLVPRIFFQQDELYGFGQFILLKSKIIFSGIGFQDTVHFVPVTMSLSYFIYSHFGLKPEIYNILGLTFHTINGLLIYVIMKKILKNKYYSILAALLFFSSNAASELIMWPVINLNTISLLFSLLAFYWLIKKYEERGYLKIIDSLIISSLFLFAVFSVEYAAGIILLIPFTAIILNKNRKLQKTILSLTPFFIAVILYLIFRFAPLIFHTQSTILASEKSIGLINKLILILKLPFIYVAQIFFGQNILINISQLISSSVFGNTSNTQFAESTIYQYVALFAGLIITAAMFWIINKGRLLNIYRYCIVFLCFIFFSSLPFIFVPGKEFSIFPSRYLYFGSVGYAVLLSLVLYILNKIKLKKEAIILLLIICAAIILGTIENYQKSSLLYSTGKIRQNILGIIQESYPHLPSKVIFYTESNSSYYGLPDGDKIFPFQSGLGQTLLLQYYKTENFPVSFFKDNFLWDITSQGYKEIQGRGFGYFRDYSLLTKTLKEYNLNSNSVIAFSWESTTQTLTDITEKVREKINLNVKKLN